MHGFFKLASMKLCTLQRFDCHRSKGNFGGQPSLAARPKMISTASCQAARNSSHQLLQKGVPLPLRRNGVRIQYLPRTLPVLSGSNKPSSLQVVHLALVQIHPQASPDGLNGVEITAARREAHGLQSMPAVDGRLQEEALVIMPDLRKSSRGP